MANTHIKKGNPFILSETDTEDIARYRGLCTLVGELVDTAPFLIIEVWVYSDKLTILTTEKKRTTKYPANVNWQWVLDKVRAAAGIDVKKKRSSLSEENARLRAALANLQK